MSIPYNQFSHSSIFSYNDVATKVDVENVWSSSNPLQSARYQFLSSYNNDGDAHRFNSFSETAAGLSNPPLMQPFCNFNPPTNGQSDKMNHKMIERERRREMKVLFSQIVAPRRKHPVCSVVQGKRAVSEQVLEAVNYVRHLQKKIEELSAQREKTKVNSAQNAKVSLRKFRNKTPAFGGSDRVYPVVNIEYAGSGIQIWMNTLEHEIVYSDILSVLEDGGLEVVSASSSAVNKRVYHTIYAKVFDLGTFNIHALYQKLWHLINVHHDKNQELKTTEARA